MIFACFHQPMFGKLLFSFRAFLNPLFGEPVLCTPDSRGVCHFRGFRDFRFSSTQPSGLCRFSELSGAV